MASSSLVYGMSLLAHGALAVVVVGMREPTRRETIAISVSEAKQKAPEPAKVTETPAPTLPKAETPRPRSHAAPARAERPEAPPPEAALHAAASNTLDALPDLGIAMDNGGPGVGVPEGGRGMDAPAPAASVRAPPPKVLTAKPADACAEPVVKTKLKSMSQPAPTTAAREANVEGRVRVEVSVGADGSVTGVRLLGGLGYGLDEASLEAARHATFEPATRCGKPVAATFVIALRFRSQ
jgi:periplasmic protein TonB